MKLTKTKMLETVRKQLVIDYNCTEKDLLTEGVVFCEARANEGRRMFDRQMPYMEIVTMGKGTVVSADTDLLKKIKPQLETKSREDLFAAPFVYGHSLYYLPDLERVHRIPCPDGFSFHVKEGKEIHGLYSVPGFENAIQYDVHHPRPDMLVTYAEKSGVIVGMAGASEDCKTMWQVGVDVLPEYRNHGLAAFLVAELTTMILERGIVPYYGTASSNIPSQMVAHRSGYQPAWMCTYHNVFDGTSPYQSLLENNLTLTYIK